MRIGPSLPWFCAYRLRRRHSPSWPAGRFFQPEADPDPSRAAWHDNGGCAQRASDGRAGLLDTWRVSLFAGCAGPRRSNRGCNRFDRDHSAGTHALESGSGRKRKTCSSHQVRSGMSNSCSESKHCPILFSRKPHRSLPTCASPACQFAYACSPVKRWLLAMQTHGCGAAARV